MSSAQISAIICTHNREQYLGLAIESLLAQDHSAFEVIVVDNASTDRTREIVESWLTDARLKYVYEPAVGLSVARNTGARVATAPILAYLDDDAIATPTWLSTLAQAYQENEKLAVAGGKVTLIWPPGMEPPRWLSADLAGNLGFYDLGSQPLLIQQSNLTPRGLNYSIRRNFLDQIGSFDINLGRVGKNLLSNEELRVTEQALELGWQVAYLPEALVAHHVAPERISPYWFLKRSWWQGVSECYREQIVGRTGMGQIRRGGERFIRGIYKSCKYFYDPAESFSNLVYAYGQIGYLSSVIKGIPLKS